VSQQTMRHQVLHGGRHHDSGDPSSDSTWSREPEKLARPHGINPKTVAKWRKRCSVADLATGPRTPRSKVLTLEEEAVVVAFRKHTPPPLDDCLYPLQATIPRLTRSSFHRCFERHGISRLPEVEGNKPNRKKFERYPIGYFNIDLAEVRAAEGKLYLFVGIDRTSKFTFVELVEHADMRAAAAFLEAVVADVPYRIHTVLTDNGIQFADLPKNPKGPTAADAAVLSIGSAFAVASNIV
jgi:transposase-like protein